MTALSFCIECKETVDVDTHFDEKGLCEAFYGIMGYTSNRPLIYPAETAIVIMRANNENGY